MENGSIQPEWLDQCRVNFGFEKKFPSAFGSLLTESTDQMLDHCGR